MKIEDDIAGEFKIIACNQTPALEMAMAEEQQQQQAPKTLNPHKEVAIKPCSREVKTPLSHLMDDVWMDETWMRFIKLNFLSFLFYLSII